jgi:hypothetical protein
VAVIVNISGVKVKLKAKMTGLKSVETKKPKLLIAEMNKN